MRTSHKGSSRTRDRSATVGALLIILSCAQLASAHPMEAKVASPQVAFSQKTEVTVTWEARTATNGLVFRLYRTSADGEVAVLAEQPAEIGSRVYNVSDRTVPQEMVTYRLVVISHRHEVELGTVVRINTQTCDPYVAVFAPHPDSAVTALSRFVTPSGRLFMGGARTGGDDVDFRLPPEPPIPRPVCHAC